MTVKTTYLIGNNTMYIGVKSLSNDNKKISDKQDAFNRLMFGDRRGVKNETMAPSSTEQQTSNIDFAKLMEHSDVLMNTFNELSPYFKKFTPLLSKFTNLLK